MSELKQSLYTDIRQVIDRAKSQVALSVNVALTEMYWHIGNKINTEILNSSRADYGRRVVKELSQRLAEDYGDNTFSEKNIYRMIRLSSVYQDFEIFASLMRKFTWTHFTLLVAIDDPLKRKFYEQMIIIEHWSVRTLRERIDSMLYERTAISKLPEQTIENELKQLESSQKMTPDLAFRDPYVLSFLGLHDSYSEKDLESAILAELQSFIVEMGSDFAFMARQKRITIDNEDYYIDLLFFHRRLKCLVAIDLKLGAFKAADKGQMELYLNWLKTYDKVEGENDPIGLILCSDKNEEHVELMHLADSNIRVAEYVTKLPDKQLLEKKLQLAIQRARSRMELQS